MLNADKAKVEWSFVVFKANSTHSTLFDIYETFPKLQNYFSFLKAVKKRNFFRITSNRNILMDIESGQNIICYLQNKKHFSILKQEKAMESSIEELEQGGSVGRDISMGLLHFCMSC